MLATAARAVVVQLKQSIASYMVQVIMPGDVQDPLQLGDDIPSALTRQCKLQSATSMAIARCRILHSFSDSYGLHSQRHINHPLAITPATFAL